MRSSLHLAVAAAIAASPCLAQQTKVLPSGAASIEGNSQTPYCSGYGAGRLQQIFDKDAVTAGAAIIREVRLRADGSSVTQPARNLSNLTVQMGHTTTSTTNMSATFASNRTSPLTTVFSGNYSLPTQTGKQQFNIVWKLSTPFLFNKAQGNLLIEWDSPGQPTKSQYFFDAHTMGASNQGSYGAFGTTGAFGSPELITVTSDATQLVPGGKMLYQAGTFQKQYTALALFGFSNKQYGPLTLPFDMTPLGASSNNLYVSMDLVFPVTWKQVNGRLLSTAEFPIPNIGGLDGFTMYAQGLYLDSTANSLGIVMSQGIGLRLPSKNVEATMIGHYDSTAATAQSGVLTGTGVVVEFEGVLP